MKFYFCEQYINTEADDKEVERDMYAALLCFQGSDDQCGYEKWESNLEDIFSYFILTSEQKCRYAQMKLVGKTCWKKCSHIDYRYWFVLKDLRALYARHLLYLSGKGYKESEVVDESKSESKVVDEPDSEFPVLVELDVFEKPRPEVIAELEPVPELELEVKEPEVKVEDPEPEVEELFIGTLVDLPMESTMELLLSSPIMRILVLLRLSDLYNPLQIFLQDTESQESGYSGCEVQLIRFSPGRIRSRLLPVH